LTLGIFVLGIVVRDETLLNLHKFLIELPPDNLLFNRVGCTEQQLARDRIDLLTLLEINRAPHVL
jgi:hypothetical protein